jgi:hypothetical protein
MPGPIQYVLGGIPVVIGAPNVVQLPPRAWRRRLVGMLFETDKTFLLDDAFASIKELLLFYDQRPDLQFLVSGHTDRVGKPTYNRGLSEERALAIAAFLKDDVEEWLARYKGRPFGKTWGTREDQHMLATLRDAQGPFYTGTINGINDGATQAAVKRFQVWNNSANPKKVNDLTLDGIGPNTRRELIRVYMDQDGTTIPKDTPLLTHGCGEKHPEIPTDDEVDEKRNRRVEIFIFEGPVEPAPQKKCPDDGCAEYEEWKRRSIETVDFDTKPKKKVYKIHPAIGIARLGKSKTDLFVGPETPGRPPVPDASSRGGQAFRNAGKELKRQAAQFRLFEYALGADVQHPDKLVPRREVTLVDPDVKAIKWTVHLANRKASFREFDELKTTTPRRNLGVPPAELDIDAGPRTVQGASRSGAAFEFKKDAATDTTRGPVDGAGKALIDTLGELRTDAEGRLQVLAAFGKSANTTTSKSAPKAITNYANNDTWFDDVSDGPVTAEITFSDGRTVVVGGWTEDACKAGAAVAPAGDQALVGGGGGAWVLCVAPDFAPHIGNIITLYDAMWDVAARKLTAAQLSFDKNFLWDAPIRATPGGTDPKELLTLRTGGSAQWRLAQLKKDGVAYKPSFTEEIQPILQRTIDYDWVIKKARGMHGSLADWAKLSDPSAANANARTGIFSRIRKPGGGGGDMPVLAGDTGDTSHLTITETQYFLMEQWSKGDFINDWPGSPPFVAAENVSPDGLERAALENCVGGAFFPGIEAGWQIRDETIYAEPFRPDHAKIKSGHFIRQMALPWQADFDDCRVHWWPGARPDQVIVGGSSKTWMRYDDGSAVPNGVPGMNEMVRLWDQMGFVVRTSAPGATPETFEEIERGGSAPKPP